MGRRDLLTLAPQQLAEMRGARVYLDANVFIYAMEGEPAVRGIVTPLFEALDAGEV